MGAGVTCPEPGRHGRRRRSGPIRARRLLHPDRWHHQPALVLPCSSGSASRGGLRVAYAILHPSLGVAAERARTSLGAVLCGPWLRGRMDSGTELVVQIFERAIVQNRCAAIWAQRRQPKDRMRRIVDRHDAIKHAQESEDCRMGGVAHDLRDDLLIVSAQSLEPCMERTRSSIRPAPPGGPARSCPSVPSTTAR